MFALECDAAEARRGRRYSPPPIVLSGGNGNGGAERSLAWGRLIRSQVRTGWAGLVAGMGEWPRQAPWLSPLGYECAWDAASADAVAPRACPAVAPIWGGWLPVLITVCRRAERWMTADAKNARQASVRATTRATAETESPGEA